LPQQQRFGGNISNLQKFIRWWNHF
jgi:hypothetical protein